MSRLSPLPLRLLLLGTLVVVLPACGKRGPPLPPLRPVPDKVTSLSFVRREMDITVNFLTPIRNADGSDVLLDRVEIYALTAMAGTLPPTFKKVFVPANRIAVLGQRPPTAKTTTDPPPDPDAAPVAIPLSFTERVVAPVPPIVLAPLPIVKSFMPGVSAPAAAPIVSPLLTSATRFYLVVPYATRTRRGAIADAVGVPLEPVPVAPTGAAIKYDEQTLTLSWVVPTGQTVNVYDASPTVPIPAKLTVTPVAALEYKLRVVFGARACFVVRIVRGVPPVFFEGAPSAPVCETPVDTFPPPAPAGLIAFASEGSISLTWDSVTATDLAGYIVLRGEGTGETLQPLTKTPITGTSFADTTTRPGVRYIYAVVAVDNATPANRSKESNRVEETGR